jgi:hypothetical protein
MELIRRKPVLNINWANPEEVVHRLYKKGIIINSTNVLGSVVSDKKLSGIISKVHMSMNSNKIASIAMYEFNKDPVSLGNTENEGAKNTSSWTVYCNGVYSKIIK